jgi:hypothetical protein
MPTVRAGSTRGIGKRVQAERFQHGPAQLGRGEADDVGFVCQKQRAREARNHGDHLPAQAGAGELLIDRAVGPAAP